MKRKLYAIRDEKAALFNPPCVFDNDAVATRAFGDLVTKDRDTVISNHAVDFALYYLGEIDVETGAISAVDGGVVCLCRGSDFIKEEK